MGREGSAEGREGSAGGKRKIREMSGNLRGNPSGQGIVVKFSEKYLKVREKSGVE